MIVAFGDLHRYRHRVVMVDGGFDPLHRGHIEYFASAARLGLPVLCNVASDAYVRTKHPPLLPQADRVAIIDAIRYIDLTHPSSHTTAEVLAELRPRAYVKGSDWASGVPSEQEQIAREHGIEILYLDTVMDSSSRILQRFLESSGTTVHQEQR